VNVERLGALDGDQRRLHQLLVHLIGEVGRQVTATVEVELAGAGHQSDPNDGFLAAADGLDRMVDDDRRTLHRRRGGSLGLGGVVVAGNLDGFSGLDDLDVLVSHVLVAHWATCLISKGTGRCAACG